jgi:hypothetical protein
MKKSVLMVALAASLFGASASAAAASVLLVTGAGSSTTSGHVVVYARALEPASGDSSVSPAVGFFQDTDSFFGDVRGVVTCIGSLTPGMVVVSGKLDGPVVAEGFTYPHFSLLLAPAANGIPNWVHLFVDDLSLMPNDCGNSLFFAAGIPDFPNDVVVTGQFEIVPDLSVRPRSDATPRRPTTFTNRTRTLSGRSHAASESR